MASRSDCYAQYRREHLTRPIAPSPITYVEDLYGKLYQTLPGWIQEEIKDDMGELSHMIESIPGSRTTGDNVFCIPPMHWHPRTVVRTGNDLLAIREAARDFPPAPTALRMAEKVISYWTSANSLKQLHRFIDSRHPVLRQVPLPDGSNISDASSHDSRASLQYEWAFRRAFIRFLHLPGLWFSGERPWERHEAFTQLYGIGRCLLELEVERCPPINTEDWSEGYLIHPSDSNGTLFSWIIPIREVVESVLDHVASAAYEEPHTLRSRFFPNRAPLPQTTSTNEERLQRNLSPQFMPALLDEMIKRYEDIMAEYPFERLVMDLLEREDTFERLLTHEHVEDRLINKQIIPHDELDIVQGPQYDARTLDNSFEETKECPSGIFLENFIHKVAEGISLVNRQRRNFRLMREWIKHRPWYTLIHVYNSSVHGNEWQSQAIQMFREYGLRDTYNDDPFIPSNSLNLLGNLFGILPYDINEPDLQGQNPFVCGICHNVATGGNEPTNTMAILPCTSRHSFHLGCVMSYWDREGKYIFSCPTCGKAPPISHERLGMHPNCDDPYFNTAHSTFVDNPFGYIIRHAIPPNLTPIDSYDIPPMGSNHRYWERENLLLALVRNAPLNWEGEMVGAQALARGGGMEGLDSMIRHISRRWRAQNIDLLHSEGFVMEGTYDAARFAPSQEVAWLRMRRRRRDRIRRRRIAETREGLTRYKL